MRLKSACVNYILTEHKANDYGYRNMPPSVVPPLYWDHRKLFLRSYEKAGELGTAEQCKEAVQEWRRIHMQEIINADLGTYTSAHY